MSTQTQSTIVGLAASGLFWLATPVVMGQGGPAPQANPSSRATPASPTYSVMLLTSGKVVRGPITRDPAGVNYILKDKGVPIAYPARMVEKAAGSVEELYQYRVSRLAERDPDERMKLARWCLTEGLPGRFKEQIDAILEMSPGHAEATRMRYSMAASDERAAMLDTQVRRTNGEMPAAVGEPAPLNPDALKKLRKDYGKDVLPRIFDLPPAQAVGRAREFTQQVHPILQNRCAGCHNEKHPGRFQLVVAKGRRDMNPDVARANLDATLLLINPEDPTRSELLSAGLVPHGNSKNAIFRGPNDVEYRKVEIWVRALRPTNSPGNPAAQGAFAGAEPTPAGDGFAADRPNRAASPGTMLTPIVPIPENEGLPPLPGASATPPTATNSGPGNTHGENYQFLLGKEYPGGPPDAAFQVPYAAGGELPESIKAAQKKAGVARPATRPLDPAVGVTAATGSDPRSVPITSGENPNKLLGMDQPLYPPTKAASAAKKKAEVDPKLLEQLIKQRNGSP